MLKNTLFFSRRLATGATIAGALVAGCQAGPSTSSSSHWLRCQTDAECHAWKKDAVCGPERYCEREKGERLTQELVFDANFSSGLDPELFTFEEGFSVRNSDAEYYTSRSENVRVDKGELILTALAEEYLEAQYTSGSVTTSGLFSFTYGR